MNKFVISLTSSAAAGALTLISPADWSPRVRRAYVLVPGVLVAAGGALVLSRITAGTTSVTPASGHEQEEVPAEPRRIPVAARVALPLGLGAATCGIQASSLWIDAWLERWFAGHGATHPRRWMAALAVLASVAMDAAGERLSADARNGRSSS